MTIGASFTLVADTTRETTESTEFANIDTLADTMLASIQTAIEDQIAAGVQGYQIAYTDDLINSDTEEARLVVRKVAKFLQTKGFAVRLNIGARPTLWQPTNETNLVTPPADVRTLFPGNVAGTSISEGGWVNPDGPNLSTRVRNLVISWFHSYKF